MEEKFKNWLKMRKESKDEFGDVLCYCGHTDKCNCGDPTITIFKDSIDYSNIIDRSALKALRSKSLRIMGDERILGSSEFVESVLKVNEDYERKTLARRKGFNSEIATTISANPFRWIF